MATYGLIPLAMNSDNRAKRIEATHSAKPSIMTPVGMPSIVRIRPGYRPVTLPTWCDLGQTCDAVLLPVTRRAMGDHLPPRQRDPLVWDSTIARVS